jgi:integrase
VRHGAIFRGRKYGVGSAIEIKLGKLSSWGWRDLELKRDELQGKADRGEPLDATELPSFSDFTAEWLRGAEKRLRSYSVISVHVRKQLKPNFGHLRLDKISPHEINRWISNRLSQVAPATVKREVSTLSAILGSAVRGRLISTNPCADTHTVTGVVGRRRFLVGEELLRLLAAADLIDESLTDLILWFLHSGMRKSEVLVLRWTDIRQLSTDRLYIQVRRSKSDAARMIPFTRTMAELIARQRARCEASEDRIFPISNMTLRRRWERVREAAGLSDVTIHDLRRTHATHAVASGVDLRTLAERIGHGSLAMLERHYAAVVGTAAVEAAGKIQLAFDRLIPNDRTTSI